MYKIRKKMLTHGKMKILKYLIINMKLKRKW